MFSVKRVRFALLLTLIALILASANVSGQWSTPIRIPRCPDTGDTTRAVRFDPDWFSQPTLIDNPWLPLWPGMQTTLEGQRVQGGAPTGHRVVFTVTDLTKVIDGVRTVVVWDQDLDQGQLTESELAFFAQDDDGNVWNLGEYPEELENGRFAGAPSTWIAGQNGAVPGIHMLARPRVTGFEYLQGWSPSIDFLDCASVFARRQRASVPFDDYYNVLVTDETSPLDPAGGHQRKYHARGVGIVQVGAVNDPEAETLALVDRVTLSPAAMAKVRETALRLDRHAYQVSQVYRHTPPAVLLTK